MKNSPLGYLGPLFKRAQAKLAALFKPPYDADQLLGMVKVFIEPSAGSDLVAGETVWAKSVGESLYKIDNIPVFSEAYHLGDIVECEDSKEYSLVVRRLKQASGNRTLRFQLAQQPNERDWKRLTGRLAQMGVECVIGFTGTCAFNLRPGIDAEEVRTLLVSELGEDKFQFLGG